MRTMIQTKGHFGAAYSAPETVELEVITEGTILSVSTGFGASQEGYNVDNDEFKW